MATDKFVGVVRWAFRALNASVVEDLATSEAERARLLLNITRQFYDCTKFATPGGEGYDGTSGPERTGIGAIVDTAEQRHMSAMRRSQTKPGSPASNPTS